LPRPGSLECVSARLPDDCVRLLNSQRGVIARWQAAGTDLQPATIDRLLRHARWQTLYRGVYAAFTGDPPRESVLWAGILRAGAGAVLSHHTAAELDGLADQPSEVTHITVGKDRQVRLGSDGSAAGLPRLVLHRCSRLDAITHPARTPPRTRLEETVLDMTQQAASFDVAFGWLCRACGRRLATPSLLLEAADRREKLRWRKEIDDALRDIADGAHSNLEFRYLRDVERAHRLPTARRQARTVIGERVRYRDGLYEEFGVAVELDGRAAHRVEDRWRDIHRDNAGAQHGIITLRYSWADVTGRSCAVAAEVASTLRLRGWDGQPCRCGKDCRIAPS